MPRKVERGQKLACPKCGAVELTTIESRPALNATVRRRKECGACGHRLTTREITNELYQQLLESQRILSKMRTWLGGNPVMQSSHTCEECKHWSNDSCGMSFPEAGGTFAEECSVFVLH